MMPKMGCTQPPHAAMCQQIASEPVTAMFSLWIGEYFKGGIPTFFKFRSEPRWVGPVRAYAWCWVLLPLVRAFLGQAIRYGEVSWEEKGSRSGQIWIPCVFGGPFLQPRPSLMAEENRWWCGGCSSGSAGYTSSSNMVWPCHGWQGSCIVSIHSWDQ